ncbi:response regulator transcription factor [Streptomyces sp. TS71-3]|uniref:response regulator transcription factor n=1 Tax=Streptomyces sp. TS71-3 TaxID=2733862 RepID=UPI001B0B71A0|nr:response regulator transcription factor [Streptomyces sp. TS71-3]GHJ39530.1 DNA-binding response regulator [Streptomyces sp. TS71-3]
MVKVLLVDDDPMVRRHLRTILAAGPDIDVVGEAEDGAEAVEEVLRSAPDVILMDIRMPGVDGVTATREIAALPGTRPAVVALTTFDSDAALLGILEAGASGFLVKSTPPEDLLNLVRVAADGHTVLSPDAARRLLALSARTEDHRRAARRRADGLSARERDVLRCLGHGLSNGEAAARLFLSEATVKSYVSRLLAKLDLPNRTQAGLLAIEAGLLEDDER